MTPEQLRKAKDFVAEMRHAAETHRLRSRESLPAIHFDASDLAALESLTELEGAAITDAAFEAAMKCWYETTTDDERMLVRYLLEDAFAALRSESHQASVETATLADELRAARVLHFNGRGLSSFEAFNAGYRAARKARVSNDDRASAEDFIIKPSPVQKDSLSEEWKAK